MDGRTLYPQSWYLKKILLISSLNGTKVIYFLSCINLSTFLPLNPAICTICNVSNILCSRCKEQDESPPHFKFCYKLLKSTLYYISGLWATLKLVSKPSHCDFYCNCRMTYIWKFYPTFWRHFLGIFTIVVGKSFIKVTIKLINSKNPNAILCLDSTSFKILLPN